MNHIEILNKNVDSFATFTDQPCCNGCNDSCDGGGGCGCNTYVCTGEVPECIPADICNLSEGCDCNVYICQVDY